MSEPKSPAPELAKKRKRVAKSAAAAPSLENKSVVAVVAGLDAPKPAAAAAPKRPRSATGAAAAPRRESERPVAARAWVCGNHPVLYGGRPGSVTIARTEEEARARLTEHLTKRGVKVDCAITFVPLKDGDVFAFQ